MHLGPNDTAEELTDREEMGELLAERIRSINERIEAYEADDDADEQLLIKWNRALAQLVGQYRHLKKDADLDRMEERLESIEDLKELQEGP